MTKSFLVKFSVSEFIAEVIASGIALGFEIAKHHMSYQDDCNIAEQSII